MNKPKPGNIDSTNGISLGGRAFNGRNGLCLEKLVRNNLTGDASGVDVNAN